MVVSASFFADDAKLYAETFPLAKKEGSYQKVVQRVVIDLSNRGLAEGLYDLSSGTNYQALTFPMLLGMESNLQTARATAIVQARLPNYTELTRVAFAPEEEPPGYGHPALSGNGELIYGHDASPVVCADRTTFVYGAGHQLVCRRVRDLNIVWDRRIGSDYFGAWLLDITPDSRRMAAAVIDDTYIEKQKKCYIGIYDGQDGSVVKELSLNGFAGISISPSGRSLALSRRIAARGEMIEPTVYIYDIASGDYITKVSHPVVSGNRRGSYGTSAISSQFTPDGKYLITSGRGLIRIWSVPGSF